MRVKTCRQMMVRSLRSKPLWSKLIVSFKETNGKKPKAKPTSPPPSATEASSGDVKKNVSEENWDKAKDLIAEVVKASSDIDWLNGVYRKNLGPINQLKDNSPKLYEELMNDFSKRKSELNSKGDQS